MTEKDLELKTIDNLEDKDIQETKIESKKTDKRNAALWFSYDMADTFFSQTVISLAFTPFALLLGVEMGWNYATTFIVVSVFMAFSNLLIAIFGPILGALSDTAGKRKPAVIIVASIMVIVTAMIAIWPNFWWGCILFIIANFCYQAGRMFYDAQIPFVAETEKRGITQAIGGAMAPIGSIVGIGVGLIMNSAKRPWGKATKVDTGIWQVGEAEIIGTINYQAFRWMFVVAAVIIVLMSIPYLFHKEVRTPPAKMTRKEHMGKSFESFKSSFKMIIHDRNSWLFFLAWFFITDAANTTIMYMVPVVSAIGGMEDTMTYIVILGGIMFSIFFGILTGILMNKWGPKKLFLTIATSWFIALVLFILTGLQITPSFTLPIAIIWPAAIFIGIGFGGIWIVGRQFIMVLAPPSRLAQYGGFQKIAGRVSAIVSPLLFGLMIFISKGLTIQNAMRVALGSLLVLFSAGIITTTFIKDPFKRYLKGERAPYTGIYEEKE